MDLLEANRELERRREEHRRAVAIPGRPAPINFPTVEPVTAVKPPKSCQQAKLYPTLTTAFLAPDKRNSRRTLARVGAAWYQLRAHDTQGRGLIAASFARSFLASSFNATPRYIRGLIRQGVGVVWDLSPAGLHLYSPARVAIALDAGPLRGRPVYVPVEDLSGGARRLRATFYAAWHAGRRHDAPITRTALRRATGVPESTQRIYDKEAGTVITANIGSAGELATKENLERRHWQHGRAAFVFYDQRGLTFRKGARVVAWQLPNGYVSAYEQAPKGRQKKHNQRINLVTNRQQGNDVAVTRIYYPTARQAAHAASRAPGDNHYYLSGRGLTVNAAKPSRLAGANVWRAL